MGTASAAPPFLALRPAAAYFLRWEFQTCYGNAGVNLSQLESTQSPCPTKMRIVNRVFAASSSDSWPFMRSTHEGVRGALHFLSCYLAMTTIPLLLLASSWGGGGAVFVGPPVSVVLAVPEGRNCVRSLLQIWILWLFFTATTVR
jgi:hypothetical protein